MEVDAIWLSPIFKSPQVDTGYDISDYRDIDPVYGTLDDLRELLDKAHQLNIKVLLDYVPNHTSDQHPWFQASLKGDSTYADYYVWRNATNTPGGRRPPNNWLSYFQDSAWEWSEERQQYYLHQFLTGQPDLNYRNPVVVEEMKDVLRYWLNFGVDGFRMDAVATLFEDSLFRDEPESENPGVDPNDHDYLDHIYTVEQPESFDMIYQWRELLDEFNANNKTYTRMMITEGTSNLATLKLFYGNEDFTRMGAHFTFNFISFSFYLPKNFTTFDLTNSITTWFRTVPRRYTDNWVLGKHDAPRVSTRLGVENIDALNMLASLLPGVQVTYQGEEIGQENGEVTCEEGTDPQAIKNCTTFPQVSRDFERTPFQWDNSVNAGFNPEINSHYNVYKQMVKLRQEFKITEKEMTQLGQDSEYVFFANRVTDNANYIFYYNIGDSEAIIETPICSDCLTVAVRSLNSEYTPSVYVFYLTKYFKAGPQVLNGGFSNPCYA